MFAPLYISHMHHTHSTIGHNEISQKNQLSFVYIRTHIHVRLTLEHAEGGVRALARSCATTFASMRTAFNAVKSSMYIHNTIRQKHKRYAHDAATLSTVSATGTVFKYTVALKSRITICCYIQARIKRTHGSCNDHGQITLNLLKFTILRIVMVVDSYCCCCCFKIARPRADGKLLPIFQSESLSN